jgi:predicted RNA-binding protein Jag
LRQKSCPCRRSSNSSNGAAHDSRHRRDTLSKDFPSQNRQQTDGKCSEILTSLRELGAANADKQSDAATRTRVDVEGEEERRGATIFNIAKKRNYFFKALKSSGILKFQKP